MNTESAQNLRAKQLRWCEAQIVKLVSEYMLVHTKNWNIKFGISLWEKKKDITSPLHTHT